MPPPTQADIRCAVEQVNARVQVLLCASEGHDEHPAEYAHRLLFAMDGARYRNWHVTESGALRPGERLASRARTQYANAPASAAPRRHDTHLDYSLHAQVRVRAHDWRRLEKSARYVLRSHIAPQYLCDLGDGRPGDVLKRPWSDGTSIVAFAPQKFQKIWRAQAP